MGNLDGLNRRLQRLEEKRSVGCVEWQLEDGTKVRFDAAEMFAGFSNMLYRTGAAWLCEPLPPLHPVCEALTRTSVEERARRFGDTGWVCDFDWYISEQTNPAEEHIEAMWEARRENSQ